MALAPGVGDMVAIRLQSGRQLTADEADKVREIVPFDCRVIAVTAGAEAIGGTTVFTDVDVTVMKGATDLLASRIAVVNGSTLAAPQTGTLSATAANLKLSSGDVLDMDADMTGGSSPTIDGLFATVYAVRE
ncbi:MAG: hypothetical protein V3T44_06335 [bacterium]